MKDYAIFFLFLLIPIGLVGQITMEEKELVETKQRIKKLTQQATEWAITNMDSSLWYAQQAVELAYLIDDKKSLQINLLIIGSGFADLKEYQRAKEVFEKIEEIGVEDTQLQIQLANEMGMLQRELMEYDLALAYHLKAKKIAKNEMATLVPTLVYIGQVYRKQQKDSLALESLLEAIALQKKNGKEQIFSAALIELGLVYEQLGKFDKAFPYFYRALMEEEDRGNTRAVTNILNRLAASYAKQKKAHSSIAESQKALELAQQTQDYEGAAAACQNLASCYRALKEFEQSLEFQDLADIYKNQLLNIEKKRLVTVMQSNFDLTQKELENQSLREKEKLLRRDLNRRMMAIAFVGLALFLALALTLMLYKFNKSRKKTNTLLQQQYNAMQTQQLELEKAMDQLKSAQNQLVQSEKMASLGQLTAGIAHEINNPVNFIYSGIAGLKKNLAALMQVVDQYDTIGDKEAFDNQRTKIQQLKSDMDYEEVRADIDGLLVSIEDGAERTGAIVNSLKTFARTDTVALNQMDVHQNIDSTLILLKNQLRDHITIHKIYDPNLPKIESYNGQVNQVIMNLLTNAIQAIEEKGKITITTKCLKPEQAIKIMITDTGKGIPEADQSHIFEPFFTTKEVGKGTGLGLSISYGIIQKHHGTIEVDSREGRGTTFRIVMPLTQDV